MGARVSHSFLSPPPNQSIPKATEPYHGFTHNTRYFLHSHCTTQAPATTVFFLDTDNSFLTAPAAALPLHTCALPWWHPHCQQRPSGARIRSGASPAEFPSLLPSCLLGWASRTSCPPLQAQPCSSAEPLCFLTTVALHTCMFTVLEFLPLLTCLGNSQSPYRPPFKGHLLGEAFPGFPQQS